MRNLLSRGALWLAGLLWMAGASAFGAAMVVNRPPHVAEIDMRFVGLMRHVGYLALLIAPLLVMTAFALGEQGAARERARTAGAGSTSARSSTRERVGLLLLVVIFFIARLRAGFRGGSGC